METNEYLVVCPPRLALRRAQPGDDPQIAAIWNEAVAFGSLTTDTEPRTPKSQRA